jgi:hypothetical protein
MRRSLLAYMAGVRFDPKYAMTIEQISDLFRQPSPLVKLGATITANNHHPDHAPELAIDGDPRTIWHTNWEPMVQPPHHLILDLKKSLRVLGLTYLPRQDMTNGRIGRYEIHASVDGKSWGQPIAAGTWPNDDVLKTVRFAEPREARFIKLVALREVNDQLYASAAEVDVILE